MSSPSSYHLEHVLDPRYSDLTSPDGSIVSLESLSPTEARAIVRMHSISSDFVGYSIEPEAMFFNIKSTLAQLGLDGISEQIDLQPGRGSAEVVVRLIAKGPIAQSLLAQLRPGAFIGRLFAADARRRVRDPSYLSRMFGRSDRFGRPLLSLGGLHGGSDLILEKIDGRTIAYLTLLHGRVTYDDAIYGLLPTLVQALSMGQQTRHLVGLHQRWQIGAIRNLQPGEILLVRTLPLHIRTVYARVVDSLLPIGYRHTSASILQPDTQASGDIYELYGESQHEIVDIPLEFYTLEPYREHVFFADRDQLQASLENPDTLFHAFSTAPQPENILASIFIVKGEQLLNLKTEDWIAREVRYHEFPGLGHGGRQALMVERFIAQQPSQPFLHGIDIGSITSEGVLLCRHFPPPLMKRLLLSDQVQRCLKGLYFQIPSESHGDFFTHEDRALLHDLFTFATPVYWVDRTSQQILQYMERPGSEVGMFVPMNKVELFLRATVLGIYGSNLIPGPFEESLTELLQGLLNMRQEMQHPLLNPKTPLALVTGGGPGAMEVGNRVAKSLSILSCANIVDFRSRDPQNEVLPQEQHQNIHIEAKMTYRKERLIERQAEFRLHLPIFLIGGIGTDFELSLEEVCRKIGATEGMPILLFGGHAYWRDKICSRFRCNLASGTISGSEWVSNCFYSVENAQEALKVYRDFFKGTLSIGKQGTIYPDGFAIVTKTGYCSASALQTP